jgi:hypothetical protein
MNKLALIRLAAAVSLTTGLGFAMVAPASAHDGGGSSRQGNCSMRSQWELKASQDGDDHRRIEVEFRIDTNRGGQTWNWTISDNQAMQLQGANRTQQGNQRIDVRRTIPNQQGVDQIMMDAQNTVTGETCQGTVVLRGGHD